MPRALVERHERSTLEVPPGASYRLGVVADTHSTPHPRALPLLRAERPDAILHAGDIGALEVLEALAAIAPLIAIRGNIDVDGPGAPPDRVDLELVAGERLLIRLLLLHIGVYGPRLRADVVRLAKRRQAQVVVCGHSHVPLIGATHGVAVFNPGSIGPRRFSLPITFGVIELGPEGLSFRHVDCETGARFRP